MIDIRRAIHEALPKDFLLDAEDRLRADALSAHVIVRKEFALSAKRSRGLEGQARFRMQEQGYEDVVQVHGGHLMTEGVITGTDLKFFQPLARFAGPEIGVILGFASMPEKRKIPPKNMSRGAGVTLNLHLQASLFPDEHTPNPTDIFVLLLTSRDRERAGMIEEIAIGVIGSDYKDFIYYESLDEFLGGYGEEPATPESPDQPSDDGKVVKLRQMRKLFSPPENQPREDAEGGSDD